MKKYIQARWLSLWITILTVTLFSQNSGYAAASLERSHSIQWTTSYKEALNLARAEHKPILLYFDGSDWCGWCMKMNKEIFASSDFIKLTSNAFIFVNVDFPIYSELPPATITQNEMLKSKYKIEGFPTLVIIDADENIIGKLNYQDIGGKAYAELLLKMIAEQKQYQKAMTELGSKNMHEMEALYATAQYLNKQKDQDTILCTALAKGGSIFFLKEQYRRELATGKMHTTATMALKADLLQRDPDNKVFVHHDVAVLEFEVYASREINGQNIDQALQPLLAYLDRFGNMSPEKHWKMEIIIAQVYENNNCKEQAIKYARLARSHAPPRARGDISRMIANLEEPNLEEQQR